MNRYIDINKKSFFAFNIWDVNSAKAVIDAACNCSRDVILQTSERVFKELDKKEFRQYIKDYSYEKNINTYLHLDHCRNIDVLKKAVDCNWDSVMYDGSGESLQNNISNTNICSEYAHNSDILIEAEVGSIIGVEDDISVREGGIASLNDVNTFLQNTSVDLIAVAFGTAHGLYKGKPILHYELIDQVKALTDIPFVVHGGTGLSDEVFKKLLSYSNVKKINISTEMKQAYRRGIQKSYENNLLLEDGFEATKIEKLINDEIFSAALNKMTLLND